ncbi:hypothetical protein H6G54_17260 [Anabaena cylindrica FACHB-243]|uniref:Uncharacterized protein n=1 Tax=Anabaena cylindrica (strain ATCC 27899 / PCC 7122) TaxID=272123 RepID=K9ZDB1_ANACC|nr:MULTISPECIES: hypothetical protein [Anabaena]AFZ56704.1 hypothetical protein Anacy_1141 [Anabaena cylindrica PCC 7122]MBD2419416.1 hypothetical protein [Anabaena cylindrica FACHB-243]MBY5283178.1 hypothetical protein [Anabaena sp. CCAP 1446/1C]MBY5310725.1 hypothetical protein [Anabaena sp. CCAP 1446/1C]MCM2408962.1 hypothetical protein [Anabaena sp. CCAP 1446/1C]
MEQQERIIYETLLGVRVCDSHWWRVRQSMIACELPLTKSGLIDVGDSFSFSISSESWEFTLGQKPLVGIIIPSGILHK